jgi:tRNA-specific 2-thiouridylase
MVAAQIEIPHYVLDYESIFKQEVMESFADDYLNGLTPIPCVKCNQSVKFRDLMKVAKDLNADAMATGHYVRRLDIDNQAQLHAAVDITKDQTYFLFATTQEQLNFLHFPLGDKTKDEVRAIAQKFNLSVSNKKDSQDICFVPNGDYVSVVQKLRPGALDSGTIIHCKTGENLGTHDGLIRYTIGQRKGIGIAYTSPLYVVKMDFTTNTLFVGEEQYLYQSSFTINNLNVLSPLLHAGNTFTAQVCLRALQPKIEAKIEIANCGTIAHITLSGNGGRAITAGQACVIYLGTQVLGGGTICKNAN